MPSQYNGEHSEIILKPRKGRGSRGIEINPTSLSHVSDEEYVVQELCQGVEITTAFYVDSNKNLHGFITFERSLENGTTTHCKVVDAYNDKLRIILSKLVEVSDFKGSANLQSIVTNENIITPFEINCRVSGTNSIRSNFGFKDVQYLLEEYLYTIKPSSPKIKNGVATRILMDVIYTEAATFGEAADPTSKYRIY